MEEGGIKPVAEKDISHLLTEDSPFMRPEFVLDHESAPLSSSRAKLFDLQHRLLQQAHDRFAARVDPSASLLPPPLSTNCSRPASPFLKPPKVIKHDKDDSLYVKVEDLPEDVRDQVRAMAAEDSNNVGDSANPARHKLPFSEPTRLSAQPTVEEIQMCFAQVDLAILMETKPSRKNTGPTFRSASATTASVGSGARAARRREKLAMPRSQENTPLPIPMRQASYYAESDQSELDNSSFTRNSKAQQNPKPFNAAPVNHANAQPPSRMQQLLMDLASSRRNSGAAIINSANETDNEDGKAVKNKPNPDQSATAVPWPPFAISSDRSRRNSEQTQHNFSFLRDDFMRKLEEIQALAATGPRSNVEDTDVRACNGSKRAYQMPVWTHGGSSSGGAGGGRVRYPNSWSGHSQGEYEVLDPLVDAGGLHGNIPTSAGDAETSTDTE